MKLLEFTGDLTSTVMAYKLREECVPFSLVFIETDESAHQCEQAASIAEMLDTPLHVIPMRPLGPLKAINEVCYFILLYSRLRRLARKVDATTFSASFDSTQVQEWQCFKKRFELCSKTTQSFAGSHHSFIVEAPLAETSPRDLIVLGDTLGAPLEMTWSCSAPGRRCGHCRSRKALFKELGVEDKKCYHHI